MKLLAITEMDPGQIWATSQGEKGTCWEVVGPSIGEMLEKVKPDKIAVLSGIDLPPGVEAQEFSKEDLCKFEVQIQTSVLYKTEDDFEVKNLSPFTIAKAQLQQLFEALIVDQEIQGIDLPPGVEAQEFSKEDLCKFEVQIQTSVLYKIEDEDGNK